MTRTLECPECDYVLELGGTDLAEKMYIEKEKHREKTGHEMKVVD